jgi:hypothetical protein
MVVNEPRNGICSLKLLDYDFIDDFCFAEKNSINKECQKREKTYDDKGKKKLTT